MTPQDSLTLLRLSWKAALKRSEGLKTNKDIETLILAHLQVEHEIVSTLRKKDLNLEDFLAEKGKNL